MSSTKPFLFRFRTRQQPAPKVEVEYDSKLDCLMVREDGSWVPAISSSRYALFSKKADIEKGEDQKGP